MAFYDKIVALAKTQVGYHEGYSDGSWNNRQKYSEELPGFGWSDYQAWCATFNTWLDWKMGLTKGAGDNSKSPCTASVGDAYQWGKDRGRFTEYPVIGAWVIFRVNEHTERCIGYDDTYVYTIGGNTISQSAGYSSQGNGVYTKQYLRSAEKITGYIVPVFPDDTYSSPDPKWHHAPAQVGTSTSTSKPASVPVIAGRKPISLGMTLSAIASQKPNGNVIICQHILNKNGFSKKALGVDLKEDGIYGPKMKTVVAYFQRFISDRDHKGWTAADCDGVLGKESFAALVSHYFVPVA